MSYLSGASGLLRRIADALDPAGAPRSTGMSFTFEPYTGLVIRRDGKGCPLWYLGRDDYERAYAETGQPVGRDQFNQTALWLLQSGGESDDS